jgi:hypothetical protein
MTVRLRVATIVGACLLAGCGSQTAAGLLPVGGLVTLNGQPLAGATVEFHPTETNTTGNGGAGVTGPDGKYTATTRRNEAGLSPGEYRVTVSRWTHKDGTPLQETESYIDTPGATQSVPAVYTDAAKTPLRAKVEAGGTVPDLVLVSKK